jgi:hypothetical protein
MVELDVARIFHFFIPTTIHIFQQGKLARIYCLCCHIDIPDDIDIGIDKQCLLGTIYARGIDYRIFMVISNLRGGI